MQPILYKKNLASTLSTEACHVGGYRSTAYTCRWNIQRYCMSPVQQRFLSEIHFSRPKDGLLVEDPKICTRMQGYTRRAKQVGKERADSRNSPYAALRLWCSWQRQINGNDPTSIRRRRHGCCGRRRDAGRHC